MPRYAIAALYKFTALPDAPALVPTLQASGDAEDLLGSLLIAPEGINGTIAGAPERLSRFLGGLRADPRFADLTWKSAEADAPPFRRFKVKLKREIVSMGAPDIVTPDTVGQYVDPADWNAAMAAADVVIDVRNDYETAIGAFAGALDPETASFREFPDWAAAAPSLQGAKTVAMYCTGGIRCEKASALLRSRGVERVLHLKGGILAYLEQIPVADSQWRGECFVFDERVSVDHALQPGAYDQCYGCRRPISAADKASPLYKPGVACPACATEASPEQTGRREERARQIKLAAARGGRHLAGKDL